MRQLATSSRGSRLARFSVCFRSEVCTNFDFVLGQVDKILLELSVFTSFKFLQCLI